jgi:hypothetical protein
MYRTFSSSYEKVRREVFIAPPNSSPKPLSLEILFYANVSAASGIE